MEDSVWANIQDIEKVLKTSLLPKTVPGTDGFLGEFFFNLQGTETSILFKLFPSREWKRKVSKLFSKANTTFIPRPSNGSTRKKQLETEYEREESSSTGMEGS